ncbi:MAG: hypothetical protein GYA23_02985 [Methanomicrobiales archaeon]|nr:hypothetical protein [Methanomicrobiales archaeon]
MDNILLSRDEPNGSHGQAHYPQPVPARSQAIILHWLSENQRAERAERPENSKEVNDKMTVRKISAVLLMLLLAAMVMVPMVSAEEKNENNVDSRTLKNTDTRNAHSIPPNYLDYSKAAQ